MVSGPEVSRERFVTLSLCQFRGMARSAPGGKSSPPRRRRDAAATPRRVRDGTGDHWALPVRSPSVHYYYTKSVPLSSPLDRILHRRTGFFFWYSTVATFILLLVLLYTLQCCIL